MRNEGRMYFDIAVLIIIAIVIYYLRSQNGDIVSPADAVMSIFGG